MFRKILMSVAAVAAALTVTVGASAGDRNRARAGIAVGVTSSSSNAKNVDANSIGRYQVGLTAQLPIAFGFAVQPSVFYQTKGTKLSDIGPEKFKLDAKAGYLEIPVQLQWGPDLVAFRPYVFVCRLWSLCEGQEIARGSISSEIHHIQGFWNGPLGIRSRTRWRYRHLEDSVLGEIFLELRFSLF